MAAESYSFLVNSYFLSENSCFRKNSLVVYILALENLAELLVKAVPVVFNGLRRQLLYLGYHIEDTLSLFGDIGFQAFALNLSHFNEALYSFGSNCGNVLPYLLLIVGSFLYIEYIGELHEL